MSKNLSWLNVPEFMRNLPVAEPLFPKKFRITSDISGFSPNSIKTELSDDKRKIIIIGQEGAPKKSIEEDY